MYETGAYRLLHQSFCHAHGYCTYARGHCVPHHACKSCMLIGVCVCRVRVVLQGLHDQSPASRAYPLLPPHTISYTPHPYALQVPPAHLWSLTPCWQAGCASFTVPALMYDSTENAGMYSDAMPGSRCRVDLAAMPKPRNSCRHAWCRTRAEKTNRSARQRTAHGRSISGSHASPTCDHVVVLRYCGFATWTLH